MELETINKLYLELSQIATAKTAREITLESAVVAMAEDGWLYHGPEGMSEAQEKCYAAYLMVKPPNAEVRGASRLAGEASSREAATSTVVLGVGGDE